MRTEYRETGSHYQHCPSDFRRARDRGLARKAGVPEHTLFAIAVWHEAPFVTDRERAALRLAEALTLLPAGPVPEDAYVDAADQFPDDALGQLVVVVTAINAWNRVMLAKRRSTEPEPELSRRCPQEAIA